MAGTNIGGLPKEFLAAICALASRDPEVERVFLFGSRANRGWRPESDVDIAIQTVGLNQGERLAAYMFLATKLEWENMGRPFGLEVDLDYYEPFSGGIVAPAVEEHGIELFRRS